MKKKFMYLATMLIALTVINNLGSLEVVRANNVSKQRCNLSYALPQDDTLDCMETISVEMKGMNNETGTVEFETMSVESPSVESSDAEKSQLHEKDEIKHRAIKKEKLIADKEYDGVVRLDSRIIETLDKVKKQRFHFINQHIRRKLSKQINLRSGFFQQ